MEKPISKSLHNILQVYRDWLNGVSLKESAYRFGVREGIISHWRAKFKKDPLLGLTRPEEAKLVEIVLDTLHARSKAMKQVKVIAFMLQNQRELLATAKMWQIVVHICDSIDNAMGTVINPEQLDIHTLAYAWPINPWELPGVWESLSELERNTLRKLIGRLDTGESKKNEKE